jgi:hypothetical protein
MTKISGTLIKRSIVTGLVTLLSAMAGFAATASEGADRTAIAIEHMERATPEAAPEPISSLGRGTRTVVTTTADVAEDVFHVAKKIVIGTGKVVVRGAEYTGKGARAAVHYTTEAGSKVVGTVKRIF